MILKSIIRFAETNSVEATWTNKGIPVKCRSYSDAQMADLENDLGADAQIYAALISDVKAHAIPYVPQPVEPPKSITMRQARLALLNAGLLDAVNTGMATMPQSVQIEWEFASTVDRSSPQVALLSAALSLNDTALDALFTAGAAL